MYTKNPNPKPFTLACRVTLEKKMRFLKKAAEVNRKPTEILESLIDYWLGLMVED